MKPNTADKNSPGSLRSRMVNAGGWVFAGYALSQVLRFGSNLVMTRLLVPEMFGTMAIVTIVMVGLAMFSDVGLLQNVVQSRRGDDERFLNTAWLVQILRGALLFIMALVGSRLLVDATWLPSGSAYADPVLPAVLAVMAVTVFISGFNSTKLLTANRKLMMGRVSLLELFSQATGTVVMIILAWLNPTIWAIVIGAIITVLIKMLLSHIVIPGPVNRFQWDSTAFHEIFNFGKWIFISSILGFLLNQGDRLMLGGLVSSGTLGVYSIAMFLAKSIQDAILKISATVFFPALSEVFRDRPQDLARIYYKVRKKVDVVVFFAAGFLFVSGDTVIHVLYDERYSDAGWMLHLLSIYLVSVGFLMAGQCFLAQGKSKLISLLIFIQVVTLYILLPVMFYQFGLSGAIIALVISPSLRVLVSFVLMRRHHILQLSNEFIMLPMLLVGALGGFFFSWVLR